MVRKKKSRLTAYCVNRVAILYDYTENQGLTFMINGTMVIIRKSENLRQKKLATE